MGLEIPCLSSGCCLKFKEKEEETKSEIRSYIALAKELGTPYIRILADLEPNPTTDVDDTYVVSILKELAPEAKTSGTTLLVETNGVYADTARLAKLLEAVDHRSVWPFGICITRIVIWASLHSRQLTILDAILNMSM